MQWFWFGILASAIWAVGLVLAIGAWTALAATVQNEEGECNGDDGDGS